jgi:hypothetical protein
MENLQARIIIKLSVSGMNLPSQVGFLTIEEVREIQARKPTQKCGKQNITSAYAQMKITRRG